MKLTFLHSCLALRQYLMEFIAAVERETPTAICIDAGFCDKSNAANDAYLPAEEVAGAVRHLRSS